MPNGIDAVSPLPLSEVERSIFALDGAADEPAHYDRMGRLYDIACGTRAYNRLVWGTTPEASRAFASRVFGSRGTGRHVEVGCGGLLFTSHLYDDDCGRECVLVDPSIAMLRMARARLERRHGKVPGHVTLLRGNGLQLGLPAGFATTVLSMHVLHVLDARVAFLRALDGLAAARESTIGFSSLVYTGTFRDRFLSMLHRAGELSSPITADELGELSHDALTGQTTIDKRGAMCFVEIHR